jgi:hypothetical protein
MAAAKKHEGWGNRLLSGTTSLGNSGETILDKCSDLLNDYCKTEAQVKEIADRSGLCPSTIKRLMDKIPTEEGHEYNPMGDTMSRVLLVFGAQITWSQVTVKAQYLPKPKEF